MDEGLFGLLELFGGGSECFLEKVRQAGRCEELVVVLLHYFFYPIK